MKLIDTGTPCVVIAAGGCWGNILSFLRSLGSRGVPVYLVGYGCDLDVARASKYCAGFKYIPTGPDDEAALNLVAWRWKMGWRRNPVLFFVSERLGGVFCSQRAVLEQGYVVPVPDASVLGPLLQKNYSLEVARRAGLQVPDFWKVTSLAELKEACVSAVLPAVIKPLGADALGSVHYKASIVADRNELIRMAEVYWNAGSKFVVQQFIPGEDASIWMYLFFRCKNSSEMYEWVGRKLRQSPAGAGIMVQGVAEYNPLVALAGRRFVEESGYWGIGGVEFKEHNGSLYFIEMNPRSEGCQAIAISDGVDLPTLAFAAAGGQCLPSPVQQKNVCCYLDGEFYLSTLKTVNRKIEWVKGLFHHILNRNVVFPVWRSDDPCPFVRSFWLSFVKICRRILRVGPP